MTKLILCPICKSKNITKRGLRKGKSRITQRYYCKDCNKSYTLGNPLNKLYSPQVILNAIMYYNLGYTLTESSKLVNKQFKIKTGKSTIHDWITDYEDLCTYTRLRKRYGYELKKKYEDNIILELDPSNCTLSINDVIEFSTLGYDKNDNSWSNVNDIVWSNTNTTSGVIDQNGTFRALKPGNVTVFASVNLTVNVRANGNNLVIGKAEIVISIDGDADGMDDDWELQYGFDIKDPANGYQDTDKDGLIDHEEFKEDILPEPELEEEEIADEELEEEEDSIGEGPTETEELEEPEEFEDLVKGKLPEKGKLPKRGKLELTQEEYEKKRAEEDKKEREKFARILSNLEERLAEDKISEATYLMLRNKK